MTLKNKGFYSNRRFPTKFVGREELDQNIIL